MSKTRWIVAGIVLVLIVAVGAPFFYIHVIEGKAPAKFTLTNTTGTGGPAVPLDGTWSVGPGSLVGYRVNEVLLGQNNTAAGRTGDVSGSFVISGSKVESGSFTVNMRTIKSDQRLRDNTVQGRVLDTATYPTATFALTKAIDLGTPPASGVVEQVTAGGNLTLRGVTKSVDIPLKVRHEGTTVQAQGSLPIVFADYKIPNPDFPGVAKVQDHGELEFLLNFVKGSSAPTTTAPQTTTTLSPAQLAARTAYNDCLASHGASVPGAGGPPPGGGSGGGGPSTTVDPVVQAARQACASLRPQGGPGGGGAPPITFDPTTLPPLGY